MKWIRDSLIYVCLTILVGVVLFLAFALWQESSSSPTSTMNCDAICPMFESKPGSTFKLSDLTQFEWDKVRIVYEYQSTTVNGNTLKVPEHYSLLVFEQAGQEKGAYCFIPSCGYFGFDGALTPEEAVFRVVKKDSPQKWDPNLKVTVIELANESKE